MYMRGINGRYHAWESLAMKYLEKLSPHRIRHEDNSFNRLVRPYVVCCGGANEQVYWAER
jgi:hypothetical protein